MTALTLEAAPERSRLLDVRAYRVELDVTGGGEAFGSVTVVRFAASLPSSARTGCLQDPSGHRGRSGLRG